MREVLKECLKCPYAVLDYDDAYGSSIWWVEECTREGGCMYRSEIEERGDDE